MAIDILTPVKITYSKEAARNISRGKIALKDAQGILTGKTILSDEFLKSKVADAALPISAREMAKKSFDPGIMPLAKKADKSINKAFAAAAAAAAITASGIGAFVYKMAQSAKKDQK